MACTWSLSLLEHGPRRSRSSRKHFSRVCLGPYRAQHDGPISQNKEYRQCRKGSIQDLPEGKQPKASNYAHMYRQQLPYTESTMVVVATLIACHIWVQEVSGPVSGPMERLPSFSEAVHICISCTSILPKRMDPILPIHDTFIFGYRAIISGILAF